ncbi:proprotein convertase subtilisin/kexin type 5-like [Ruditapes philippinarum]|uniref:proprotein convertase subtilisin/kexin type 5-like n=1 Tax=Ruditapes philippinarum TaxID=129788 RepID=UPI00295B4D9A|nr:proprotein convertase subtilisin/kexin type 5-like [Ruditapes philippinarum]
MRPWYNHKWGFKTRFWFTNLNSSTRQVSLRRGRGIKIEGGRGTDCQVECACCVDKKCGQGRWYKNECTSGCIDGYWGARCYKECSHSCKKCKDNFCIECNDGYYMNSPGTCSKCLTGCKICTSGNTCTSCKNKYYNDNGHNDCRNRVDICPQNCNCKDNQCESCKEGFYDPSNSCISSCPVNCITCSSNKTCEICKDGNYNGYGYGNSSRRLRNDCSHVCPDNCDECTSYNNCTVCRSGFHGLRCEQQCSSAPAQTGWTATSTVFVLVAVLAGSAICIFVLVITLINLKLRYRSQVKKEEFAIHHDNTCPEKETNIRVPTCHYENTDDLRRPV